MCLNLRDQSYSPYNSRKIRWKIARISNGWYAAPYRAMLYKRGVNIVPERREVYWDREHQGFHVFLSRADARKFKKKAFNSKDYSVIKVKVGDFLASGEFCGFRSETWNEMTILAK